MPEIDLSNSNNKKWSPKNCLKERKKGKGYVFQPERSLLKKGVDGPRKEHPYSGETQKHAHPNNKRHRVGKKSWRGLKCTCSLRQSVKLPVLGLG